MKLPLYFMVMLALTGLATETQAAAGFQYRADESTTFHFDPEQGVFISSTDNPGKVRKVLDARLSLFPVTEKDQAGLYALPGRQFLAVQREPGNLSGSPFHMVQTSTGKLVSFYRDGTAVELPDLHHSKSDVAYVGEVPLIRGSHRPVKIQFPDGEIDLQLITLDRGPYGRTEFWEGFLFHPKKGLVEIGKLYQNAASIEVVKGRYLVDNGNGTPRMSDPVELFGRKKFGIFPDVDMKILPRPKTPANVVLADSSEFVRNGEKGDAPASVAEAPEGKTSEGKTPNAMESETVSASRQAADKPSPELSKSFIDFSEEIRKSPVVFAEQDPKLADQIRMNLAKKEVGSTVVVGDSGSGKTEAIRTFVKNVLDGNYPELPANTQFIYLDAAGLMSDTKYRGSFEEKLRTLVDHAVKNRAILIIDEIHSLRGSGSHEGSSIDFFQLIKPYLSNGRLRIIGMTTEDEYNAYLAGDPAIGRRLPKVHKDPIPREKVKPALIEWSKKHGYKPLSDDQLEATVRISSEFDAVGTGLSKAVRLQEEVYARGVVKGTGPHENGVKAVEEAAVSLYDANPALFNPEPRKALLNALPEKLDATIAKLENVKRGLVMDTEVALYGTGDRNKPQGRRMFAGPKGVGKTFVPEAYAKEMGLPFLRVSLAEYGSRPREDLLREIGDQIRKNAFSVIFIDEVDKAPPQLQDALLRLLDSDHLIMTESLDGTPSGPQTRTKVQMKNATLLFATNAGKDYIRANPRIDPAKLRAAMVQDGISEYLLDRMRYVDAFPPPRTAEEVKAILSLKLDSIIRDKVKSLGRPITLSSDTKNKLLNRLVPEPFRPDLVESIRLIETEAHNALEHALAVALREAEPGAVCEVSFAALAKSL